MILGFRKKGYVLLLFTQYEFVEITCFKTEVIFEEIRMIDTRNGKEHLHRTTLWSNGKRRRLGLHLEVKLPS